MYANLILAEFYICFVASKIRNTAIIIAIIFSSSVVFSSCKSTKKDCDCPTFGEKNKKPKKTRYKKPK